MAAHRARSFGVAWPRLDAGPAPVAAMISALVDRLEKRPGEAFALFCLGHAALWTLLPAALYPNLPLDLIEALTYGREWQLGYDKLPPLPWWLIEGTYRLFGSDTALYLVAQVTVVAAFGLGRARPRLRACAMGEVFHRHPGAPARAVPAARPRRAPRPQDARSLCGGAG